MFVSLSHFYIFNIDITTATRHQYPDKRPSFPDVVDELLAIEKEVPDSKYTEVSV